MTHYSIASFFLIIITPSTSSYNLSNLLYIPTVVFNSLQARVTDILFSSVKSTIFLYNAISSLVISYLIYSLSLFNL